MQETSVWQGIVRGLFLEITFTIGNTIHCYFLPILTTSSVKHDSIFRTITVNYHNSEKLDVSTDR